jgi:hypothetical protein
MDWNSLGPAVFSLLGVALGTIGSLLGVYYAQRSAREQARLQHSAAMRIERRDIYLEYLSAIENSWSFLDGLWGRQPLTSADGVPLKDDAVDREAAIRNHEVWYYQQKLATRRFERSSKCRPRSDQQDVRSDISSRTSH